jgi:NitT/TauT family transport system ATP-binding protein
MTDVDQAERVAATRPQVSPFDAIGPQPKLVVDGVSKTFRRGRARVDALESVDLHVDAGELVCLLGASGCGKSTLLSIVGGLEEPTSGVVLVDGERVVGPGADRGMVFQGYSLFPWKTVTENIAFGLEVGRWPKAKRVERVNELLGVVGLSDFADALPKELSGGMKQRVAIARALAPEPDVLLLDEPFGALDAVTKRHLQDFLLTVWHRLGATILMVTHDVEEAIYLSSRVYVMSARPGRIASEVVVPFGDVRGATIKRDQRFLDLRDELDDMLG